MKLRYIPAVFALIILSSPIFSEPLPADSMIPNIKTDFGAKGDGVTDDTKAFQEALPFANSAFVYVPAGTYIVSDKIRGPGRRGTIWGESKEKSIIKLKDNCPGYQDPKSPRPVLTLGGDFDNAFLCYARDITIDVGKGNPGAIALQYQCVNVGGIYDMKIVSSDPAYAGLYGLHLKGPNGPGLAKNIEVIGFQRGIYMGGGHAQQTFENIILKHQTEGGLVTTTNCHPFSIRNITSINTVPAISGGGMMVVVGGKFTGGSSDTYGIVRPKNSTYYVRNIEVEGYKGVGGDTEGNPVIDAMNIEEHHTKRHDKLFDNSPDAMMKIPIKETPYPEWGDPSKWVNVRHVVPGVDYKDAYLDHLFQKAIDDGAEVIYWTGTARFKKPVHVRNKVRRIIGLGYRPTLNCSYASKNNPVSPDEYTANLRAAFIIEDGSAPVVSLERVYSGGGLPIAEYNTDRPFILKDINYPFFYAASEKGEIFFENVALQQSFYKGQNIYIRSFNPEYTRNSNPVFNSKNPKVRVDGGMMWVLGFKTEGRQIVYEMKNNAKLEILGGLIRPCSQEPGPDEPCISSINSHVSVAGLWEYLNGGHYDVLVREQRGAEVKQLLPQKGDAYFLGFFTGYDPETYNVTVQTTPADFFSRQIGLQITGGQAYRVIAPFSASYTVYSVSGKRISQGMLREGETVLVLNGASRMPYIFSVTAEKNASLNKILIPVE